MHTNQTIEKAILNTIIYFDIFDFPLTSFEIWKNLYSKESCTLEEVVITLNTSIVLKEKLSLQDSFYFLKGREFILNKRKSNYITTFDKYKKGINFIKLISSFNFIKSVFVANSLSIDNGRQDSDIDLFIISKKNNIWITRFISVVIAQLLGLRPNDKTKKDKICLTIFLDEENLNLKRVCSKDDIYYIYWINQVVPVYDPSNIYERFIEENKWSREYIKNIFKYNTGYKRVLKNTSHKRTVRRITSIFTSSLLNTISKKIEISLFSKDIKDRITNKDSEDIVVDDTIIKLHNNKNRDYFHNLFLERTRQHE